jgi:hypothetical protein
LSATHAVETWSDLVWWYDASTRNEQLLLVILSDEIASFLTGGVSITIASRSAELIPSVARAKGCVVVQGAAPKLRILLSAAQAGSCLDDIRATGLISATFSIPNTHRTVQLKGTDAAIVAFTASDREVVTAYVRAFAQAIRPLGFSEEFTHAFFASPPDEVGIEFTPAEAFQQTPGPKAGTRLS